MPANPVNPDGTTAPSPSWVNMLTVQDFIALGLDGETCASCADRITVLAHADNVDLKNITACLEVLHSGADLLHIGAPLALMAYCPAIQCFKAMYDGVHDDATATMTEARAGLWLTLLASEVGRLPTRRGDWGLINIHRDGAGVIHLEGPDAEAIKLYQRDASALDSYHTLIRSAVSTCIKHMLGDG